MHRLFVTIIAAAIWISVGNALVSQDAIAQLAQHAIRSGTEFGSHTQMELYSDGKTTVVEFQAVDDVPPGKGCPVIDTSTDDGKEGLFYLPKSSKVDFGAALEGVGTIQKWRDSAKDSGFVFVAGILKEKSNDMWRIEWNDCENHTKSITTSIGPKSLLCNNAARITANDVKVGDAIVAKIATIPENSAIKIVGGPFSVKAYPMMGTVTLDIGQQFRPGADGGCG